MIWKSNFSLKSFAFNNYGGKLQKFYQNFSQFKEFSAFV